MLMKRINYLVVHTIQTIIYILLAIIMTIIKPANEHDKIFMAFYGFLVVISIVCILVLITVMFWSKSDE